MIREAIEVVVSGGSLSMEAAAQAMNKIMIGEATPAQFGAFVTALRLKGETVDEIAGMAQVMRQHSLRVELDGTMVDTCGTGGDGSRTFNISTAAAFVAAGAGAKVAKHGNRAMSGSSGSADVLEALGVNITLSPESVARCIDETGFGFMFAQGFHPSMRFAAGPRREIGIRTVFNILGPLTNPAGAGAQVIGVADASTAAKMAQALNRLGSRRALVVHGNDGLDEITIADSTQVWELNEGAVSEYLISPEDLGFSKSPLSEVQVSDTGQSARMLRDVLNGSAGAARDIVLLNAAAALLAGGQVDNLQDGVAAAAKSIDEGGAKSRMEAFIALSRHLE
ncbi:MAG: anthranilate phosphoribosyltransferase [Chloroflexi bacterium]|nr:anthranilate phosphoribosyltransferase [Chloroflexota bacterium]